MGGLVLLVGGTAVNGSPGCEGRERETLAFDESRCVHMKSAILRSGAKNEREKGDSMMSRKERLELVLSIRDTSVGGRLPNARERRPTQSWTGRNDAKMD